MWTNDVFEQVASEMAMSDAVRGKINEKLGVNASTSSFNKPLNLPNNVVPFLERNSEYSRLFNSGIPGTVAVPPRNLSPYYGVPQTGLGEGYVRDPTYVPKSPSYVVSWEKPQTDLPFNLGEIEHPYSKYFGKTVNSNNPLEWHPSSFNGPKIDPFFNVKSIVNPALGTLAGLAALDEAINGKNPTALGMLIPNAAGMGLGSLFYSTPLNEGEDEMMAAINAGSNLPFQGSVAAATNGTDIAVDPNAAKQYTDSIASSLNFEPPVNPDDLLNKAIKYNKFIKDAMQKGTAIAPQEDSQIAIQGVPDVKPETDTMEVVNLDETPVRKSAGEITPSSVEVNTKTYDSNGNLVSGSDPNVNTSKNTQKTLGTTPQGKGYITNEDKTVTVGDVKVPAKTTTSNPPADATTVPAPSKTDSSAPAKQGNFTRQRHRTSLLSTPELTKAILNNEFGNGKERIDNLTAQGYSPEQIKAAQDQINKMMRPVRSRTSRAPVQQRRISPTLAEAVIYNRPDTIPVQTPVTRPNTNASGYTKGHEAVFNPRTGRLEFI